MNKEELHIHKFEYQGSGTGYEAGEATYSDGGYLCECGQKFTMLLPTKVYFDRKYPQVFMTENTDMDYNTLQVGDRVFVRFGYGWKRATIIATKPTVLFSLNVFSGAIIEKLDPLAWSYIGPALTPKKSFFKRLWLSLNKKEN